MRLVLAATKALNSTATALTDVAAYLQMIPIALAANMPGGPTIRRSRLNAEVYLYSLTSFISYLGQLCKRLALFCFLSFRL